MKTIRLATASLWCRKRRTMTSVWLRARTVNSRSGAAATPAPGCGPEGTLVSVGASFASVGGRLVIANPRVEYAVQQVGDQVEDDDDQSRDKQPTGDRISIVVADRSQQEIAHAVPLEDRLRDDGATQDGGEVERHDRCQRD